MVAAMVEPQDLVRRIPSRRFATRAPVVRNAHLIPPAAQDAMAYAWGTRDYPPRDVTIHRVPGAFVLGEGLVFDHTGVVVRPTITQHSPAEVDAAEALLHAAMTTGAIPFIPGTTLLCAKRGAVNYGHWLYEMLPVAALGLAELQAGAWRAMVPHASGPL
ncbi:MAG: hypothetical protein H7Z10_04210, partial [Gemmatimonadaceae bacterium]|nr:hypothetical protein [Acetobacteraceae bacterium]